MTQRIELTVKEYAKQERVTQQTVWRWIAKGALPIRRTPGGRLRVVILTTKATEAHDR
jgi:excisionase family DNA binding protein